MRTARFAALVLLGVTLIAAGPPQSTQSARAKSKGSVMTAGTACKNDALHRSRCMIELILDDLEKTLGTVAGGGISQIKATTSTSYAVKTRWHLDDPEEQAAFEEQQSRERATKDEAANMTYLHTLDEQTRSGIFGPYRADDVA